MIAEQVTRGYADFVVGLRDRSLPDEAVAAARRAILDTLACTLAGSREPAAAIACSVAHELGGKPQASVIGSGVRLSVAHAALVNGTAAHALDYDDVHYLLNGHPSAPILPAVLALAEQLSADGETAVKAFVAGVEVECRLGQSQGPSHYARGWHATSTHGTVGAAAASAFLLGLDAGRTATALAIAGSMAAGSRQNFGTMTKPLHAGRAAEAGLTAALLARAGFSADSAMLEGPLGFIALFSPGGDARPERALEGLGRPFAIASPGVAVKKYPCCFNTHRALDAVLLLRHEHGLEPDDVASIEVRLPESSAQPLIHSRPLTGLEGKFSMEYCVAAAIADGPPRLGSFTDYAVRRAELQSLLRRVQMDLAPAEDGVAGGFAEVRIRTRDRRDLQLRVDEPRGAAADPLSWDELEEKFLDSASVVLSDEQAEDALTAVRGFDRLPDLNGLMHVLAPRAALIV